MSRGGVKHVVKVGDNRNGKGIVTNKGTATGDPKVKPTTRLNPIARVLRNGGV